MGNELLALTAARDLLSGGSYGTDIQGFYLRPDELLENFHSPGPFCTVGVTEDVPRQYDYDTLSGGEIMRYSMTFRFFISATAIEVGSLEVLELQKCERPISAEVARLIFSDDRLGGEVLESFVLESALSLLYLRGQEYTGIEFTLPVVQEV